MGITPTALSGTITTSAMQTELDRVRDWINTGVVVGDLAANGITRQAVYRPNVYGFPLQGSEGVVQDVWGVQRCIENAATRPGVRSSSGASGGRHFIAQAFGRTSAMQYHLESNTFRFATVSKRFVLDVASFVEIGCHFEAIGVTSWTVDYPHVGGRFSLQYKEVGGATATRVSGSRRTLNACYTNYATDSHTTRANLFSTGGAVSLAAGTYDVWLQFDRDASSSVFQVVLGVASLKIEVHKT